MNETEVLEPQMALTGRALPISTDELAQLDGKRGEELLAKRMAILELARRGSIARTFPRDWTLFKGESGVYAYLQDSGCERMMDIWGIEISNISGFSEEAQEDGSVLYIVMGDGHSRLTGRDVFAVLGSRDTGSMEMGREVNAAKLKIETMKAARSNLDGSIVRHLAGLASVPIEELNKVFSRSDPQDLVGFNLGKGFGRQTERHGASGSKADYGLAPDCPKCKTKMRLFDKDQSSPYWGCPSYKTCGQKTIPAKKVESESKSEASPSQTTEEPPLKVGDFKNQLLELITQLPTQEERKAFKDLVFKAKTIEELKTLQKQMNDTISPPERQPGEEA
jgi:hypothetical protein